MPNNAMDSSDPTPDSATDPRQRIRELEQNLVELKGQIARQAGPVAAVRFLLAVLCVGVTLWAVVGLAFVLAFRMSS